MIDKLLPALDTSDSSMRRALIELLSDKVLIDIFQTQDFVRRCVATIDNLPRQKFAPRLIPVRPPVGPFRITHNDGSMAIATDNAARYSPYVRLAAALNTPNLVSAYIHVYPLFQRAYQELGYPKGYFNDRLIEVIDHLLTTPETKGPVSIAQPKVLFILADSDFEALSAGQKIMIRIGSENAAIIMKKLREIRVEITRQPGTRLRSPTLQ